MAAAEPTSDWIERTVEPRPFLVGVVVAFLVCCVLGRATTYYCQYPNFVRFHGLINTESQFFPTASQVRALARDRLDRDRIAVIVGGNSILFGTGQGPTELWTLRLQELLGDEYRVLNLATPSARPWEFGGLAAEFLEREFPRLIYVAGDRIQCYGNERPDGVTYRSFFWDAYAKGLVPPDADRDAALAAPLANEKAQGELHDLQLRMVVDRWTYANDLWTSTTAQAFNSVWVRQVSRRPFAPRNRWKDATPTALPLEKRVAGAYDEEGDRSATRIARYNNSQTFAKDCIRRFPGAQARRTCLLVLRENTRYIERLEPELRQRVEGFCKDVRPLLAAGGFRPLIVGADYEPADYMDNCHLSPTGGRKLAAMVAPEVRAVAERLGYLRTEERR